MLEVTCEALWNVSALGQSSVEADKFQIWAEVVEKSLKAEMPGKGAELYFKPLGTLSGCRGFCATSSTLNHFSHHNASDLARQW